MTFNFGRLAAALAVLMVPASAWADGVCPVPTDLPAVRTGRGLTVESPVRPDLRRLHYRLRSHVDGSLAASERRFWVGPEVPEFVPLTSGSRELTLLDLAGDRWMAFYRDTYGAGSCSSGDDGNCTYEVRVFDCAGVTLATLSLDQFFSRKTDLEVQDVRLAGDTLYFNEACQSYSRQAGGKCSSLLAVDIRTGRRLWRSRPLVSNNVFLVYGDWLITGYGFTGERSSLFFLRRSDGAVVESQRLARLVYPGGNHHALDLGADGLLRVGITEHPEPVFFRIDAGKPRLVLVSQPKPITDQRFLPDGSPNPAYRMPSPPTD